MTESAQPQTPGKRLLGFSSMLAFLSFLIMIVWIPSVAADELPLNASDITRLEQPGQIQYNSALLDNGTILVYESWQGYDMDAGELRILPIAPSADALTFGAPTTLNAGNPTNRTSVSVIARNNEQWLYFVEADTFKDSAFAIRAKLENGKLTDRQELEIPGGLSARSNARWHVTDDGQVVVALTALKCCKVSFAQSQDGVHFSEPQEVSKGGFMPHIASFMDGALLLLYQAAFRTEHVRDNGKPIFITKTHFRISPDAGESWGDAVPLTQNDRTIHDGKALRRLDGNLDIYYVYPVKGSRSLSLWRRCINTDGAMGAEELVVDRAFGNLAKPTPHRLPSGQVLLTFVEQGEVVMQGDHNLHAAVISGDSAACDGSVAAPNPQVH